MKYLITVERNGMDNLEIEYPMAELRDMEKKRIMESIKKAGDNGFVEIGKAMVRVRAIESIISEEKAEKTWERRRKTTKKKLQEPLQLQ